MHRLVVLAVPVFVLLMACEFACGWLRGRNTYRLDDTVASLSQGLLSQAVAVCTQLFQIGLYAWLAPSLALWARPDFWNSIAGWVIAILLFDFCDYWLHRAGHESAVFWAAHSVHHQSRRFNLSTALRQESLVALLGWVFYLPMAVAGVPPEQFGLAGLIVLLYQFWIHTEHIGKLGAFDRVFSSPSNHRVHHAVNDEYIDHNYGGMLVIWDRLFGTFAEEAAPCVYGTRDRLEGNDPLQAIFGPYAPLWRDARRTRRWRDKLRVWIMPPGWQPADLALQDPKPAFSLAAARSEAAPVPRRHGAAGTLQFLLWTAVVLRFLWCADDLRYGVDAALLALCGAGLWLTGALLDARLRMRTAWLLQLAGLGIAAALLWPR